MPTSRAETETAPQAESTSNSDTGTQGGEVTETNKIEEPRPTEANIDQEPGELEDLEARDADVTGGDGNGAAGGIDIDEVW